MVVPRDVRDVISAIHEVLEIPVEESTVYVEALSSGRVTPMNAQTLASAKSLAARGMFIVDSSGSSYLPVHPRMALSNLFRAYEERAIRQRKEKRLQVDKLTLELLAVLPDESKSTNPGSPRVGRKGKGGVSR